MKKRHTNIPAIYLILEKNNQILLLQRKNTGYMDGFYSLVAGHIEPGEDAKTACVRESKEEANLTIKPEDLDFIHVMHRKSFDSERVDFFFKAKKWQGDIKNVEKDLCGDLAWFGKKDLPKKTIPYVRFALKKISQNIFYSQRGWDKAE